MGEHLEWGELDMSETAILAAIEAFVAPGDLA
jgi:hypothetical protein